MKTNKEVEHKAPVIIFCTEAQAKKHGKELAKFYNLKQIRYNWQGTLALETYNSLYLTYREDVYNINKQMGVIKAITIEQAVEEYNNAIEYTPWRQGKPRKQGEYMAFSTKFPGGADLFYVRRWWNGKYWSCSYLITTPQYVQDRAAGLPSLRLNNKNTWWRGLSKKPIYLDQISK